MIHWFDGERTAGPLCRGAGNGAAEHPYQVDCPECMRLLDESNRAWYPKKPTSEVPEEVLRLEAAQEYSKYMGGDLTNREMEEFMKFLILPSATARRYRRIQMLYGILGWLFVLACVAGVVYGVAYAR